MSPLMPRELACQGWASCDQVIRRHGEVRPFARIRAAERQRIQQLWQLFIRHGLPIPENPWAGAISSAESLPAACAQALEQERARLRCCAARTHQDWLWQTALS